MTRTTTPRYDAEEAKKELLATLHASRELGPEMDDALADRFIERLSALRPAGSFDPERTRADLKSLLNSARGSDPAGDDALVVNFLTNIQPPTPAMPAYAPYAPYPIVPGRAEYGPAVRVPQGGLSRGAPALLMLAIMIGILILSHGQAWFLVFLVPMFMNWGRRGSYQRRIERDQRRAYRHDRILNRDDPYHPLPPSGPPEIL